MNRRRSMPSLPSSLRTASIITDGPHKWMRRERICGICPSSSAVMNPRAGPCRR